METTVDYLVRGGNDGKAKAYLKGAELLKQFKAVEKFTDENKTVRNENGNNTTILTILRDIIHLITAPGFRVFRHSERVKSLPV